MHLEGWIFIKVVQYNNRGKELRLLLQLEVKISKTIHNYKSNFPKVICIYNILLKKKRTINKEHKLSSHL